MSVPTQAGAALPPPLPLHVRTHRLALPHNGFHIFIKDVSQAPHAVSFKVVVDVYRTLK